MPAELDEAVSSREGAHHQSSIETILDGCSWQYYLGNVLKIPQGAKPHSLVGTSFHSAVELHERARMDGTPEPTANDMIELAASQIDADFESIPPQMLVGKDGKPWTRDTLVEMASSAITNWHSAKLKDGGVPHRVWLQDFEPVAIEPYFRLDLIEGSLPIGGWIDGVYRKPDGRLFLVDQKTAGDFSRWPADGSGHRTQATMYTVALLLSPDFPEVDRYDIEMHYLVSRTRVGNVERARRVTVTPGMDDVQYLGERIRKTDEIMSSMSYAPNPAWTLCSPRFCQFYEGCQITRELRKPPEELVRRYKNA